MPSTQLILTPQHEAAPSEGGPFDLLVQVKAPEQPSVAVARKRLRLAIVIDRSGSMSGQPLAEAVRCAQRIIDGLLPDDEAAVLLYDEQVQVPIPMQRSESAKRLARALTDVESGGCTALFDGWCAGLAQLGDPPADALSRVILLSDGQANSGPAKLAEFEPEARAAALKGVATTTVGLGRGFNEDLMVGLAQVSGGQHYYGETADDLFDAFEEEFSLLQALCARKLKLYFTAGAGVQAEVVSDVSERGPDWLRLSDLAYGSRSWALLRLHIAPATAAEADRRNLLTVRLEGEGVGETVVDTVPVRLDLSCLPLGMVARLPQPAELVERRTEVLFAKALTDIREAVRSGDKAAETAAAEAARSLARGQPWLEQKLASLLELIARDQGMFEKEAMYSAKRLNVRLSAETSACYSMDETGALHAPSFLRRKVREGKGRPGS